MTNRKNRCVALLLLLTIGSASAQIPVTPNKKTANGSKEGLWSVVYDKNWKQTTLKDSIQYYRVLNYKNNIPVGTVTDYLLSGTKQWEGALFSEEPEKYQGNCTWYHPNGAIATTAHYINGKKEGRVLSYFESGKIQSINHYAEDNKYGIDTTYFENGNVQLNQQFSENKPDGWFVYYFENGTISIMGSFKGETRTGVWRWFKEDGSLDIEKHFDEKGEVTFEVDSKEKSDKLGKQYFAAKEYNLALFYYIVSASFAEQKYTQESEVYSNALFYMAECYRSLENQKEAEKNYLRHLQIKEKLLGKTHPHTGIAHYSVAYFYRENYDYPKAEMHFKESIAIAKKQKDKSEYYSTLYSYGICLFSQEKNSEAEAVFAELKTYEEKTNGNSTDNYSNYIDFLADIYIRTGRYNEGEKLILERLGLLEKKYGKNTLEYAQQLNNLGKSYSIRNKRQEAETTFLNALIILKELGLQSSSDYINITSNLADIYKESGRLKDAETLMLPLDALTRTSNHLTASNKITIWNTLGSVYQIATQYTKALEYQKKGVDAEIALRGENHINIATYYNNLALTYENLARYDEAEAYYLKSLEIKQKVYSKTSRQVAPTLSNLGYLYMAKSDFTRARAHFNEALAIRAVDPGKESVEYAYSLHSLGLLCYYTEDYKESETYYLQALAIKEKLLGKNAEYAVTLNNMGILYDNLQLWDKALSVHLEALAIREKTLGKTHGDYAHSLSNTAGVYAHTLNYSKAEEYYLQALQIDETIYGKHHPQYATTLNNIAVLYMDVNQVKAELYLLESLDIYKTIKGPNTLSVATCYSNLGAVYRRLKRYEDSEKAYKESLRILEILFGKDHSSYGEDLSKLASTYNESQEFAKTEEAYKNSLKISIRKVYSVFPILSENEKSAFYNGMNVSFNNFYGLCADRSAQNPNISADMFNYRLATKAILLNESNRIRNFVLNSKDSSLVNLYKASKEKQNLLANAYKMSVEEKKRINLQPEKLEAEIEDMERKISLRLSALGKYTEPKNPTWQTIQKKLKPGEAAIEIISTLKQDLSYTFGFIGKGIKYDSIYNDYAKIREIVSEKTPAYKAGIRGGEKIISINGTTTRNKSIAEIVKLFSNPKIELELEPAFKPGERKKVVVESDSVYNKNIDYKTVYVALIVTPLTKNYPDMILLENGEALDKKYLTNYRNSIKFRTDDSISYHNYWKPIADKLTGIKKVYVSSDGVYNQINLNTLYNPKTRKYLLDEIQIQNVTNTKDLLSFSEVNPTGKFTASFIGFPNYKATHQEMSLVATKYGNIKETNTLQNSIALSSDTISDGQRGGIAELPGTKTEINAISSLFEANKKGDIKIFLHNEALEEAVKHVHNPRVMHIATHGYFETNASEAKTNPLLRSGLLLAGAENAIRNKKPAPGSGLEDGILTAYEASGLQLENTELVVLSACETGLGEVKNGEGVYGLQRAFIVAGARTVIISLWKVNDDATRKLMTKFYEYWLQGMEKRMAFTKAQDELMKEYKDPYYWGAFIMVGN